MALIGKIYVSVFTEKCTDEPVQTYFKAMGLQGSIDGDAFLYNDGIFRKFPRISGNIVVHTPLGVILVVG